MLLPSVLLEDRGRNRTRSDFSGLRVWYSSFMDMEADINDRLRYSKFVHLLRLAKQFMANDAWGATNLLSRFLSRPRSRAVRPARPLEHEGYTKSSAHSPNACNIELGLPVKIFQENLLLLPS